jgi:hypothetical protein
MAEVAATIDERCYFLIFFSIRFFRAVRLWPTRIHQSNEVCSLYSLGRTGRKYCYFLFIGQEAHDASNDIFAR